MMKYKLLCLLLLLGLLPGISDAQTNSSKGDEAIKGLVSRLLPGHENKFTFKITGKKGKLYYKISGKNNTIIIEGNSSTSVASGLNRYLKDFVHISVNWTDLRPQMPATLPVPAKVVAGSSSYDIVTYLNYCTFGYTTTYWDWSRWEQEIDLMALCGITHPLAMTGVEQVWRNTLVKIGYTDEEAKKFLTGPAYMPWLVMGNMETLGGPMPDEWFDRQVTLQKKILARMKEYGMQPIFQAFFGMMPTDFKEKFPEAQVVDQGLWNGFKRPVVLSPLDPQFKKIAKVWYDEYKVLYGQANYFGGDLFHEGGNTGDLDVAQSAKAVQDIMLEDNTPAAVWVLQSWGQNPTKKLLEKLSPQHTLVVELCAEYWNRWKETEGYYGMPWAWSNISNWGGNIGLHGRLDAIAGQPVAALQDAKASKSLTGIGFTPEGIETNPVVMDLWSDMVWLQQTPDMNTWITNYPQYRYGSDLPSLQNAWKLFYKTAYGTYATHRRPSEPVFCAKPSLNVTTVSSWSQSKIFYDPAEFAKACHIFLTDANKLKDNKNYQYDAVDMVRQYISNLGRTTYAALVDAYKKKDKAEFEKQSQLFLQLIADQDKLLLSHKGFCLYPWLQEARNAGSTESIKDQYEFYNRLILTSWSLNEGSLDDYTHREWGGLLKTYYWERWKLYFDYLIKSWDNPSIPKPNLFAITQLWLYKDIDQEIKPNSEDPVGAALKIFNKYYHE